MKDITRIRTGLIIIGAIILRSVNSSFPYLYIENLTLYYFFYFLGVGLTLWGCYLWTKLKNRHWAFMFWGLLTPIGLIGIWKLKDKSKQLNDTE